MGGGGREGEGVERMIVLCMGERGQETQGREKGRGKQEGITEVGNKSRQLVRELEGGNMRFSSAPDHALLLSCLRLAL